MTLDTGDYVKLYISDRTIDSYSVVNRVEVIQSGGLIIDSLPYPPTVLEEYGCNFEYTGWRWNTNNFPLVWWQGRATSDCTSEFAAIGSAFTTWQSEPYSTVSFTMNSGVPTYTDTNHDDTQNVCLFNFFSGFIAACWSYHYGTGEIYGFDILFNDNYDWRTSTSSGNIFYVQEIATHEEGHVLDLNDLYYAGNSEQTMYGYSNYGETKKQSLNTGDTAGIQLIYPWDSQPSVAITSPLGGYAYDSPVSIVASVTCSDPITQCKFKITSVSDFSYDSGWITMTYSSGAWRGTWTTTRHGAHYITVRAITNSYVYGYDTHSFNVNMT
jgi:hypothetical protein